MQTNKLTRFTALTVTVLSIAAVAGCGANSSNNSQSTNAQSPAGGSSSASSSDAVSVQAAQKEGTVHGFGMPSNWANLGNMWSSFQSTYGIKTVYQAEGDMSSAEELQAFQKEMNHPVGDVGDIGISFGPTAVQMGVVAPYKNKYWDQIPDNLKDPNGYWAAAYYGTIAFEVNTTKVKDVPHTWADLLKPEYKGLIGFDDPRQAAVAFDAVVAAAYANGGSLNNLEPGIKFFKQLYASHNWTGSKGETAQMQTGQTAINITWNYLGTADQQLLKGKDDIVVVVPSDSTVAGPYVEVINKYAPHPNAARLLNEYLFSDAGQISYAEGGAYPVRLSHLQLPADVKLPPLNMSTVHFLTDSSSTAQKSLSQNWGYEVLGQ